MKQCLDRLRAKQNCIQYFRTGLQSEPKVNPYELQSLEVDAVSTNLFSELYISAVNQDCFLMTK